MSVLFWAFCRYTEMGQQGSDITNIFLFLLGIAIDITIGYCIWKGH